MSWKFRSIAVSIEGNQVEMVSRISYEPEDLYKMGDNGSEVINQTIFVQYIQKIRFEKSLIRNSVE